MRYYISDLHFFHESLNTQMDCRGFKDAAQMNAYMIKQWNSRVRYSRKRCSFTKDLTLANGTNTITVVATDSAGKSTTVTRTVTPDTGAPVIKSVTLTPNPVDSGKTFVISVEVTD